MKKTGIQPYLLRVSSRAGSVLAAGFLAAAAPAPALASLTNLSPRVAQSSAFPIATNLLLTPEREQIEVLGPAASPHGPLAPLSAITNLEAALGLPPEEARRGYPIKALATVTYCHPQWRTLFVLGDSQGTYIRIAPETPTARPGDIVEIEGATTIANGYSEVKASGVKLTGQRQALVPRRWSLGEILDGRASGQWVEVQGRVLATYPQEERLVIQAMVGTSNLVAFLLHWRPEQARQLLGARVRLRGVVSIQQDSQGHPNGTALLAQESEQVQVIESAAVNPLDLPATPISGLAVPKEGEQGRRAHVQAVLQQVLPGWRVAVRDRTGLIRAQCSFKPEFPLDSRVDVIGYPTLTNGELILTGAVLLPTAAPTRAGNSITLGTPAPNVSLPLLRTVRSVRQLSRNEAARGYPVRLEGIVTYSDPLWWCVFVQDETGAIFTAPASSELEVGFGQHVRVEGVTSAGDFAPTVTKATFTKLADAPTPAPITVALENLLSGQFDCRWVEIQGRVESTLEQDRRLWLHVLTPRGQFRALLAPAISRAQAERLVGARVTLRGSAGGEVNRQGQIIAVRLHIPELSAIHVDEPPAADPFAGPAQSIGDLLRFRAEESIPDRVKVAGWVTSLAAEDSITLEDASGGMLVHLVQRERLPGLGDHVEALGYPAIDNASVALRNACLRILGPGQQPPAITATPEAILSGEHNGRLVRIQARLIEDGSMRPGSTLVLQAGSVVFDALLPATLSLRASQPLVASSHLALTGVCLTRSGQWGQIKSFQLLLRRPEDLIVLTRPPWWNLRRLAWGMGSASLAGVVAVAWGLLLSRKNRLLEEQIRQRQKAEIGLQEAQTQLRLANDQLEQRVTVRTLELSQANDLLTNEVEQHKRTELELRRTQGKLLEASRRAGMAEVATGVLHNVGNVLNSVNVSINVINEHLRSSQTGNLAKVCSLLKDHQADLGAFLTTDPKGRRVPELLSHLAMAQEEERTSLLGEAQTLTQNVEHVKEIVAMQQSYAKVAGVIEDLPAATLVEDALRMNAGALTRHSVVVKREFNEVPLVRVDRHKVLQILVNLVRNAKYALDAADRNDKVLTLGVAMNGTGCVKLVVRDNGVGIAPENLTRIFSHGFTTKKDGHGFGLHSGALAAKEMGGCLQAFSEGPGTGATFILELPIATETASADKGRNHEQSA